MATKRDIFKTHLTEWLKCKGDREKRGEMVQRIAATARVHPKSVGRSFRRVQMEDSTASEHRGRPVYYTKEVDSALFDLWEAANRPCGELLHPLIRDYIAVLARDGMWEHGDEATGKLQAMSKMTVRRRVARLQRRYGVSLGKSTTRASELKHSIPVFKGPWKGLDPGNGQLDTVAHCGDSIAGDYAYTVSFVDAPTYWGVRRAQWNKGQQATKESLIGVKERLPFPWLMGHPDTGSEFINYLTKEWCDENGIALTRSEPNRKNDNMYVEERNGHVVRRYLGWQRLDADPEIVILMNELYEVLDPYLNHFQAVRRTLSKEKVGSKYRRTYEKRAQTPYERLMEHPNVSPEVKEAVRQERERLNPLLLKRKIDMLLAKIYDYQKTRSRGNRK